jgi:NAD(P)-dependent dehydrogenase (short-subunit alcohol dehydrogenase family)
MKIVVVGAAGTIGAAVTAALEANKHEVIRASRKLAPRIDISDPQSIRRFFAEVKDLDGVVSCAGDARFAPLDKLTDEDFLFSVSNKLMGQVNLIRAALPVIRDNGSITVTSGVLAKYPMIGSGAVSLVNAGLEGFTRVAALEATRAVRVNVVSPGWVKETMVKFGMDPTPGKAAVDVARAYVEAVEGSMKGESRSDLGGAGVSRWRSLFRRSRDCPPSSSVTALAHWEHAAACEELVNCKMSGVGVTRSRMRLLTDPSGFDRGGERLEARIGW